LFRGLRKTHIFCVLSPGRFLLVKRIKGYLSYLLAAGCGKNEVFAAQNLGRLQAAQIVGSQTVLLRFQLVMVILSLTTIGLK
jgi:hypothetical protein